MADRMFPGKYQSDFAVQVTSQIADAQQSTSIRRYTQEHDQGQEQLAQHPRRPLVPIEQAMIIGKVRSVRQTARPQRRRHRVPSGRQDRAIQQHDGLRNAGAVKATAKVETNSGLSLRPAERPGSAGCVTRLPRNSRRARDLLVFHYGETELSGALL